MILLRFVKHHTTNKSYFINKLKIADIIYQLFYKLFI